MFENNESENSREAATLEENVVNGKGPFVLRLLNVVPVDLLKLLEEIENEGAETVK